MRGTQEDVGTSPGDGDRRRDLERARDAAERVARRLALLFSIRLPRVAPGG